MKVDTGFWDVNGEYIESIEELTMEEEKEIMSEEIIIEGVNVAECCYYNKDEAFPCEIWQNECEAQNCYFKQLKRLQAENERLKEKLWQLQHRKMWNKEATLQAELLIKENEELKKRNKENLHYLACMTSQRNKLKLALEEIREINKKWLSRWLNDPDERYGFEEIKSKINEVLKEQQ